MPTNFELAGFEKVAALIYIIGALIVLVAANKVQQAEVQKQDTPSPPTPTQLALEASWVYLIGNVIFWLISEARLKKVEAGILAGTEKGTADPNIFIASGWLLGVLGSILRVIGVGQRAQQEQPVTIL